MIQVIQYNPNSKRFMLSRKKKNKEAKKHPKIQSQHKKKEKGASMVFSSNPLSLSVPDPLFDSWLRQNGYPEILEQRPTSITPITTTTTATATDASTTAKNGFFASLYSTIYILISLFATNPFSKLTNDDLAAPTPPWQSGFIGDYESYSFPVSASQAQLRVQENVKRYARNYAWLLVVVFACSL